MTPSRTRPRLTVVPKAGPRLDHASQVSHWPYTRFRGRQLQRRTWPSTKADELSSDRDPDSTERGEDVAALETRARDALTKVLGSLDGRSGPSPERNDEHPPVASASRKWPIGHIGLFTSILAAVGATLLLSGAQPRAWMAAKMLGIPGIDNVVVAPATLRLGPEAVSTVQSRLAARLIAPDPLLPFSLSAAPVTKPVGLARIAKLSTVAGLDPVPPEQDARLPKARPTPASRRIERPKGGDRRISEQRSAPLPIPAGQPKNSLSRGEPPTQHSAHRNGLNAPRDLLQSLFGGFRIGSGTQEPNGRPDL
jgi:hypothetical protein